MRCTSWTAAGSFALVLSLSATASAQEEPLTPAPAPAPVVAPAVPLVPAGTDADAEAARVTLARYGGPWSAPTLLFNPAGALPAWSGRVLVGAEYQTDIRGRDPIRPRLGVELGLPYRFTVELGARWLGGTGEATERFSPTVAVRFQLFGRPDGMGLLGGLTARFKSTGFTGASSEMEFSYAMQYRAPRFDVGGEAVFGQALFADERDAEVRAYGTVRVHEMFAVGLGGQVRVGLGDEDLAHGPGWDLRGGLLASFTVERYQVGLLAGASNYRLPSGVDLTPFGQLFATCQFN
jgi:hypothetical protein